MCHETLHVIGEKLQVRRRPVTIGLPMAAQVDADEPEAVGKRALAFEKAAMGHQAVEKNERPPLPFVLERDLRPVAGPEPPQEASPCPVSRPIAGGLLKYEPIFNSEFVHDFLMMRW
jgi:hypothetical protein